MALGPKAKLLHAISNGRVPNAWLFVGAELEELRAAAREVSQALVCEKSPQACQVCGPCRRVLAGSSESVMWLEPEKNTIKIESAREVLQQLSLSGGGRNRVVIVSQAHLLNPQAANALLKVIEEPPPQTLFILITGSQESVLCTIRSRSQLIYFPSTNQSHLSDAPREGEALAQQAWQQFWEQPSAEVVHFLRENVSGREEALQLVRYWHEFVRDHWYSAKRQVSHEQLSHWSTQLLQCERDILGNCDPQLTMENMVQQLKSPSAEI